MLAEQSALIERLKAKIVELEQRVKKNGGNSSKPPFGDGLSKPPPTSSLRGNGTTQGRSLAALGMMWGVTFFIYCIYIIF